MPRAFAPALVCLIVLAPALACSSETPAPPPVQAGPSALSGIKTRDAVRFAAIGDTGTGLGPQREIGARMAEIRTIVPFTFVLMAGDMLYGAEHRQATAMDYRVKFEVPYRALLESGVTFHGALGNHDRPAEIHYPGFNMGGRRYYMFERGDVAFFALDTTWLDAMQLDWLERELTRTRARWKVAFYHHPIYSSGKEYGPDLRLRAALEPLFTKHRVDVVFSGHEHFYERIKPQHGVRYFIVGSGGKLRRGNIRRSELTEAGFDTANAFLIAAIAGDAFHFEVFSSDGRVVDRGTFTQSQR